MEKAASVTRKGRRIEYKRHEPERAAANSPIAIYLSGYGTPVEMLDEIIADHRNRGISAVAVDSYGNGASGRSTNVADYSLAEHEADLEAVLEGEGVGKATIVGHSLGAMIALKFAADHPDVVEGLGLISATYQPKETFEMNWLRKLEVRLAPFIMEPIENVINDTFRVARGESGYRLDFKNGVFKRGDFWIWLEFIAKRSRMETEVVRTQGKAVMQYDLRGILGKVHAPTQLINGRDDFLVPYQTMGYLREHIPGAKGFPPVVIDGAGHSVITQKPREVVKALDSLFESPAYQGRLLSLT